MQMTNDMEKHTESSRDILKQEYLRENPYTLPQGYFNAVEDSVRIKIHGKDSHGSSLKSVFQTTIALASVFAIVFGFGYGAMYLTQTGKFDSEHIYSQTGYDSSDSLTDELIINIIGNEHITISSFADIDDSPELSDSLSAINKDYIEQYLIDSDVSLVTLASLD